MTDLTLKNKSKALTHLSFLIHLMISRVDAMTHREPDHRGQGEVREDQELELVVDVRVTARIQSAARPDQRLAGMRPAERASRPLPRPKAGVSAQASRVLPSGARRASQPVDSWSMVERGFWLGRGLPKFGIAEPSPHSSLSSIQDGKKQVSI